jgi:hypothetical protein
MHKCVNKGLFGEKMMMVVMQFITAMEVIVNSIFILVEK